MSSITALTRVSSALDTSGAWGAEDGACRGHRRSPPQGAQGWRWVGGCRGRWLDAGTLLLSWAPAGLPVRVAALPWLQHPSFTGLARGSFSPLPLLWCGFVASCVSQK